MTQQQAWEALNDPEVLKLCIPGCDKVEASGENQYAVAMALKIGPVSAKFAGKITLADIVPPESYTIAFDGSGGVAGFGKGHRPGAVGTSACRRVGPAALRVALHRARHRGRQDRAARPAAHRRGCQNHGRRFFKRFDNEMQRRYPGRWPTPQDTVMSHAPTQPIALPTDSASLGRHAGVGLDCHRRGGIGGGGVVNELNKPALAVR